MQIIGPKLTAQPQCEAVLRSLPEWFGIEESLLMYARDTQRLPTFATQDRERMVGFISLHEHFPTSWEIHCIAVMREARGNGLGRTLLAHAESWLVTQGARLLQVKTVAATHPSVHYAQTREFYSSAGFVPVEVFPLLWSPSNPCLQLVKFLAA